MKALRLVLHQNSANYRKEEAVENKMTYPLPPFSTIIGAIHSACGFRDYQAMDISVQGRYESMHKEPYTDYCFLNNIHDDRGILVKMRNGGLLSTAFERVASAKKSQGNSFRNNITIQVHNQELLNDYQRLKDLNDEIAAFKKNRLASVYNWIKLRKKHLLEKKKQMDKSDEGYPQVIAREKEIKEIETRIKKEVDAYQQQYYTVPISHYRSLTTSLKYYEILDNIDLVIHIRAEEKILQTMHENIYNLKSIGRSEDFVDVDMEASKIVELVQKNNCNIMNVNSAYIGYEELRDERVWPQNVKAGQEDAVNGTKYFLNKNYVIENGKRKFVKKKVMYISNYGIKSTSENIYLDLEDGKEYIVNFI